jgi:multidrug efflux pump subunit AcrB
VPEDDQGAIFVIVQLPGGASVERTSEVMRQAEKIVQADPAVAEFNSIIGLNFIDNFSQPNAGFMVVSFKPFDERKGAGLGARDVIARLRTEFREIEGDWSCLWRRHRLWGSGREAASPTCSRTCRAAISGDRHRFFADWSLQPMEIRSSVACSALLGQQSVNLSRYQSRQGSNFGRSAERCLPGAAGFVGGLFRQQRESVRADMAGAVQADAADRSKIDDIYRINVRNADGQMVPMRSLVEVRAVLGPPAIIRYNNLRAVRFRETRRPEYHPARL